MFLFASSVFVGPRNTTAVNVDVQNHPAQSKTRKNRGIVLDASKIEIVVTALIKKIQDGNKYKI